MLRLLETPNSTYEQKWSVLQSLQQMYTDPSWAIDVFLNYDCDLHGLDVFEQYDPTLEPRFCLSIPDPFVCVSVCLFV